MKNMKTKAVIGTLIACMLFTGCSDILNEKSRATYDPTFFETETGVEGGLTALYAYLRNIYGTISWLNACETGTDEYTWGWSADNNYKNADLSGVGELNADTSQSNQLWGQAFPAINTASGVIEYGTEAGVDEALLAEAYFFRAFYYFQLVQTFGGVPLDLGAGELQFNISATRTSVRNTVPEVYTKAIFPDLLHAIDYLPTTGRVTGGVTVALARLILAKAYLTYAWWLENPKNISTYPECSRTDPDGNSAANYFQKAYDLSMEVINNPGPFSLQETFYNLHVGSNDRNSELMLYADHTEGSEYYDNADHSYSGGDGNTAVWAVTMNYTLLRSFSSTTWSSTNFFESVQREAAQAYGRPWSCMAPPQGVFLETFADKTYDSRYDATFVSRFHSNWTKNPSDAGVEFVYNANNMQVYPGDVILSFLDEDDPDIDYEQTYLNEYGNPDYLPLHPGALPGRSDFVIGPSEISRRRYPNLWKLGTYRTDNNGGLGQPNGALTRPFPIVKLSEAYLIAAEAAVKGASGSKSAYDLVNVIRRRAGKWNYRNNDDYAVDVDYGDEMVAATPTTIDIDYILAERSREYYGEGYRWHDLVRTQMWEEKAQNFVIGGATSDAASDGDGTNRGGDYYTREIDDHYYLRPIPTSQLDGLEMTEAEKAAYQNPGY